MSSGQTRTYERTGSVVFLKTNEAFGGLSNMAGGFPLRVNGVRILTSEALYLACRFPHLPDVQRLIIEQRSPMTAKMKSKPHRKNSRADWDQVRVKIMRWCLRVKLAQNWRKFSELLLETDDRPIVEQSRKDDFWGAKPVDDDTLVGMNVLGRLLMELRETVKAESRESLSCVQPLAILDFFLGGEPIEVVATRVAEIEPVPTDAAGRKGEPELDRLSNILKTFNEQFGTLFADTDRVAQRIRDDIAPKVAADAAYQNAKENTPHTARMAHDQALGKVMQLPLKDDTQVYKQFVENESFKRFVGDMVYAITNP